MIFIFYLVTNGMIICLSTFLPILLLVNSKKVDGLFGHNGALCLYTSIAIIHSFNDHLSKAYTIYLGYWNDLEICLESRGVERSQPRIKSMIYRYIRFNHH